MGYDPGWLITVNLLASVLINNSVFNCKSLHELAEAKRARELPRNSKVIRTEVVVSAPLCSGWSERKATWSRCFCLGAAARIDGCTENDVLAPESAAHMYSSPGGSADSARTRGCGVGEIADGRE